MTINPNPPQADQIPNNFQYLNPKVLKKTTIVASRFTRIKIRGREKGGRLYKDGCYRE